MNTRLSHPSGMAPRTLPLAAACLVTALCMGSALGAATLISADELNAGQAHAAADLLTDRVACDRLAGNPRDLCREQARGRELVTKAELDFAHTGTQGALDQLTTTKLDTAYDLARMLYNDKAGNDRNVCTKEAQAVRVKGQADLRLHQRTSMPKRDAADDRRDTDYEVASEKCNAMAADAHASCMAAAKAKAGKT